jgi:hypothetical protein
VLVALSIDGIVVVAALGLLATGASPLVLAFAAILGVAPWASIIDQREGPRHR